jgi:inosine/xanthosine triphosphatase
MKVIVGSLNPTKIEGTKIAFSQYFDGVEIEGAEVNSGVVDQPFNEDTVIGAINRAINAYSEEYDFAVGIEAGLFRFEGTMTGYIDFQVAAIYNGHRTTIGFGPGFEYPRTVIDRALEGVEVGDVMKEITGIERLGESFGAIHYLTKGVILRSELSRLAVTMALIPWINSKFYEL